MLGFNLFIEYHESKDLRRRGEFLTCLHENIKNPLLKSIYVVVSDESKLFLHHEKVKIVKMQSRPTFKEVFKHCNENFAGEVCIIACGDIILSEDIRLLADLDDKTFIALTRWNIEYDGFTGERLNVFMNNASSQDVWVFRAPIKIPAESNFNFGACWGCDNRIAYLMDKEGYKVKNPSLQIKTYHLHLNNFRSISMKDNSVAGPYLLLEPNDDINKDTKCVKISGFDSVLGQPILCS